MAKILVIDDERPTLGMFRLFLEKYGHEVLLAENGADGLELFAREAPPVVLTDIKMPGMDGIEVLKRIKQANPAVEVIVITGHGDMDLAIQALNLDATDFINKPIKKEELDAALHRAEERLRLAKDKEEDVRVKTDEAVTAIEIKASVTAESEAALLDACRRAQASGGGILLNFSENASINGAGIAILTRVLLDCRDKGIRTAISGLSENFRTVFGIVGLSRLTEIYGNEQEARTALTA
ncbi:response regulator receiver protein [Desulfovibrio sp. X2]|uniref:response regulator n=1 Tax=Desulfovibrio sp. X2 TaxID=941449 RepID=UPI000358AAD5|nr:response regulator [Desulfovibrio sp. X2]EPR37313.1 response regulator receiver protein [Desulfovibrio sp. X2]